MNSKWLELYNYLSASKYPKSEMEILEHLNCSKSTLDRAKRDLRGKGIAVLPPRNGGYKILDKDKNLKCFGEYFMNQQDIIDLVHAIKILSTIVNKHNLDDILKPSLQKLLTILPNLDNDKLDFIDYFSHGERWQSNDIFQTILQSFYNNKQILIQYNKRSGQLTNQERKISPQRILRYQSNYYLIAYCHLRKEIRTFALDCILKCELLNTKIKQLDKSLISEYYQQTYGIFSGAKIETATLKFSKDISQWIKSECWHPQQQSYFDEDQSYVLSIPIGKNLTELIMKLAMYGKDVEVISPLRLKNSLKKHYQQALKQLNHIKI